MPSPYGLLAETYDAVLGVPFFAGQRFAFERLVTQYRVRFRSAVDLGCGTGLFACYLRRRWRVPVFAVDRSPAMLRVARRNCRGLGVQLLRQDLRRLCLPRRVDLATANFDTLNHLLTGRDVRRACRRVHDALRPGGHFIFDLLTPCLRRLSFRLRGTRLPDRSTLLQRIRWHLPEGLFSTTLIRLCHGRARPSMFVNVERAYPPGAMVRWLRQIGFQIRGVHDAAALRRSRSCTPRVLVIARRPGR